MKTKRLSKWVLFSLFLGILLGSATVFAPNQGFQETDLIADMSDIRAASLLNDGTDQYSLVFTTGGAASWFYTDNTYYYGGDAIQSGLIGDSQSSYVQTAVTGPGSIQFHWMVSSDINGDTLKFYIDSTLMNSVSGFVEWQLNNYSIGSGGHTLKWEYAKDGAFSYYSDCGWIDYIKWSGASERILFDDITFKDNYNESILNYNYQTEMASSAYYHCIWLQSALSSNNFNLYLYSDVLYSNLIASSTRDAGNLEWVLTRPSSACSYYPKTERVLGTGDAYIQWEDSSTSLSVDTPYSGAGNSTECIELYRIYLNREMPYRFILDVPGGGDYDLYIYSLSFDTAVNYSGYLTCSETIGNGADEIISTFIPSTSDYFAVVVAWRGGSGAYSITANIIRIPLLLNIPRNESYSSGRSYCYETGSASSSSYHCVWLQPALSSNDFNLDLFSDRLYSSLRASSKRGPGCIDWVVFRPSGSQAYYPRVNTSAGSGNAYIQWENSSNALSIGQTYSGAVDASDCMVIYRVTLSSSSYYNIVLDVPNGGDYDLYLYSLSSGGAASSSGYSQKSNTTGIGIDEMISTYVSTGNSYAVIVIWRSGDGVFYLTINNYVLLSDDSSRYVSYSPNKSYYYRTGIYTDPSFFHCVWLRPNLTSNDFNLFLYADNYYSSLKASSTRGAGYLDWIMFRPSSAQYYYPKVDTYSGSGTAYIQWEDSSSIITLGNSYSGTVSPSDCIETYQIYLTYESSYKFELDVPTTGDYDLYIYSMSAGTFTNYSGYSQCSAIVGKGVDEIITGFIPSISDYYAVILSWKSGSGNYNLKVSPYNIALLNEVAQYSYYNNSVYYQTGLASSTEYHCVWLKPTLSSNNFDLKLYSDAGYSSLRASSTRGAGELDWVIFRPSSTRYYYPKVERVSGSGNAYIEWEDSYPSLSLGINQSGAGSISEAIELYRVYLSSSRPYRITLDVPPNGDYDLYLYSLSSDGATGYSGFSRCSENIGIGIDEQILDYVPSISDYYAVVVVWKSGMGAYYLKFSINNTILLDDSARYEYYNSGSSYYYQTESASAFFYHCIWLQPVSSSVDFNLYLYSDSSYATLKQSSVRGNGLLDWVLARPSASQYFYPRCFSYIGSGNAYVEWESSSISLSPGASYSVFLSPSEGIEIFGIALSNSSLYNFILNNPMDADFDLYLYYLNAGSTTNSSGYIRGSMVSGIGLNEQIINYQPTFSGDYAVFIVWKTGNGIANLSIFTSCIPQFNGVSVSPINPIYLQNQFYQFNCSWTDDLGLDTVIFNFNGVNYTNIMNSSSTYFYTLVDLPVNNNGYPYKWLANDTSGNWGVTPTYIYIIGKKIPEFQLYLNSKRENCVIDQSEYVNITASLLEPSNLGNFTIYLNGSERGSSCFSRQIARIIQFPEAGNYNITCTFLENQNLTRNNQMYWLNVRDTEPPEIVHSLNLIYLNCTALQYDHSGLRIAVAVSDNVLVSHVIIRENSTGNFINRTMINTLGNVSWIILSIKGLKFSDFLGYWFYANDTSNNWRFEGNLTEHYTLRIQDFIMPGMCNIDPGIDYPPNFVLVNSLFTVSGGNDFGGSGIDYYQYKWESGQWLNGNRDNYSDLSNGVHILFYRAVDKAGNSGICQNFTVYVLADKADYDNDGLTNFAEIFTYSTNLFKWDTDEDGLSDSAEVLLYETNPNEWDTDSDGISDGSEIIMGADPLDPTDPLMGRIFLIMELIMGCVLSVVMIGIVKHKKSKASYSNILMTKENQKVASFHYLINAFPSLQRIFIEKEKIKIPIELQHLSDEDLFEFFDTIIGWVPENEIRILMNTLLKRNSITGKIDRLIIPLINLKTMIETRESPINRNLLNRFVQLLILIKTSSFK